jgi:hypothetical protein
MLLQLAQMQLYPHKTAIAQKSSLHVVKCLQKCFHVRKVDAETNPFEAGFPDMS